MAEDKSEEGASFSLDRFTETAGKFLNEQLGLKGVAGQVSEALDGTLGAASQSVAAGVASARQHGEVAYSQAHSWWETGVAHFHSAEDRAFGTLRQGVDLVAANQEAAAAGGLVAAAVLLPGPRRFLLRRTLGRLRSEEAAFTSAEQRYASLAESVEAQGREAQKLQERLELAAEEYRRGLAKLRSTAGELQNLSSRVYATQKNAKLLVDDLRYLPSKAALQLRSDAATKAAAAVSQRTQLEKTIHKVAKEFGI